MKIPFYLHSLGKEDVDEVMKVIQSPFLSTGQIVHDFEARLAQFTGNEHAVGVMSCTHAIELALRLYNIGPGDEVITTAYTFVATLNAIVHTGARPVLVDVQPETGTLDPAQLESRITPRTRAVIPVHIYGLLCDMAAIRQLALRRELKIIEDAAHCVEGIREGYRPGNLAHAACFSFYATKNLTSGEGGAIAVHDQAEADRLATLALHGMSKSAYKRFQGEFQLWDVEELGMKANMSNIQAALLINQLDRLGVYRQRREAICQAYERGFADLPEVRFQIIPPNAQSARHLFALWLQDGTRRNRLVQQLNATGVGCTVNWPAPHLTSYYQKHFGFKPGDFPHAEQIARGTFSLPLYPGLTDDQVALVIQIVRELIRSGAA